MPWSPLKFIGKEISICPHCHHIIFGHYKKLRHQALCKKRKKGKESAERRGLRVTRWISYGHRMKRLKLGLGEYGIFRKTWRDLIGLA